MFLVRLVLVGVQERRLHEGDEQGQAQQDGTVRPHRTFAYSTPGGP
jgi:hypothetical protein